jgi:hypothetical protein
VVRIPPPHRYSVHMWMKLYTDHYCLTNCTEDKGFRAGDATGGCETGLVSR